MSNLPLKPLSWTEISEKVRNDPSICELDKGALWIADDNLIFRYNIKNNPNSKELPFIVNYGGRQPKEVDSIEYGKHWAENTHYASQMQPYVKPLPTWIDVNKREPTEKGDYLIRDHQGRVAIGEYDQGFYMASGSEKWGMVAHWMPIPEFKQGE